MFAQSMLCSVQRSNRYFAWKPMYCAVIVQPMDCCWCLYNRMAAIPFKALLINKYKQLSIESKYMHGIEYYVDSAEPQKIFLMKICHTN